MGKTTLAKTRGMRMDAKCIWRKELPWSGEQSQDSWTHGGRPLADLKAACSFCQVNRNEDDGMALGPKQHQAESFISIYFYLLLSGRDLLHRLKSKQTNQAELFITHITEA